jgi:hypothetical protein
MIPYLLAIAGGYLIGDANKDKQLFAEGGDIGIKEYAIFVTEASNDAFQKILEVVKEKNLDSAIKTAKDKTKEGVFCEVYDSSNNIKTLGEEQFVGYTNPNDKENFYYSSGIKGNFTPLLLNY